MFDWSLINFNKDFCLVLCISRGCDNNNTVSGLICSILMQDRNKLEIYG